MNMLRNIKFRLSALAVLLLATSCLDKYPESAIPEKDAMKTFADAEQTLTGIYATFKSSSLFSGRLTLLPDIQADLVYAVEGNSNQFGNFWRWDVRPTSTSKAFTPTSTPSSAAATSSSNASTK